VNIITSNSNQAYSGSTDTAKTTSSAPVLNSESSTKNEPQRTTDSVEISTRSQKIQKLSQEFFPGGAQEIRITPAFISRLQEYELISASEAASLNASKGIADEETADSLGELADFVDSFSEKLEKQESDTSLIATLNQASLVLNSWEDNNRANSDALNNVVQELSLVTASEEFEAFSVEERKSLLELELAMNVAQRLSPESNVSEKVNQYLSVLSGG